MADGLQGGLGTPGNLPPRPPRRSGSGCLLWGLGGCGVIALLAIIGLIVMARSPGVQDIARGIGSAGSCHGALTAIATALQEYREANKGKYPPALKALVPKYLPDEAALGCGNVQGEYTPPGPNAPDDAAVYTLRTGEGSLIGSQQIYYMRLLKDGRIVLDQVTRQEIRTR